MNVSEVVNHVKVEACKNSPSILMGIGIAGMLTSTVLAVKATPKAIRLITEKENEKEADLTKTEIVKATWKCYIPSVVTSGLSIACLIGSNNINLRRNAALATAYSISENALRLYQEKVVEEIGEKKERAIRDEVAKEKINRDPIVNKEVIITGRGEQLCYDSVGGRYFKCDIEKIRKIEAKLNKRLFSEMFVSLNDFYYEVGMTCTELGDELGWNVDDGQIDFDFSSQLAADDTPCLVIGYRIAPRYDFRKLM